MTDRRTARIWQTAAAIIALFAAIRLIGVIGSCITGRCRVSGDAFDDRMSSLQRTDPKLLLYTEGKRIPTGLVQLRGLALDKDGRIYVAGDYAIRVYQADGAHKSDIRLSSEPYCLAVAPDGTIYVGMRDHVEVYDRKGSRLAAWNPPSKKAYFTSIAATGKEVWVGDAGDRAVLKYSPSGMVSAVFGAKDAAKNAPGLILPSPHLDVVPAANGAIWISDPGRHQLELYTSDGRLKRSWGKESFKIDGFSGCCNPTDFAILPDGRFVTSEKGLPRVKVYLPDGKFECVVAGREAFTAEVAGLDLATDAHGRILVLDPATRTVRTFVRKGKAKP